MSVIRDPDRIIAAWLASGPTHLTEASRQAIAVGARSTPQLRRGVVSRSGITRLQALGLAATIGLVALVGAVMAIGSERLTDRQPTPRPSTPVARATTTFESPLYGYSIEVPEAWHAAAATERWVVGDALGGSAFDRFDGPDAAGAPHAFVVAAARLTDGITPETWRESAVPSRYASMGSGRLWRCIQEVERTGGGIREAVPDASWHDAIVGGREGWFREGCGFVDGVVVVGRQAFVFSAGGALVWDGATDATRDIFNRFVASFVPPAAPPTAPTATATFVSAVYGYSIDYPASCDVVAATEPWAPNEKIWAGPQPWGRGLHVDRFCGEDATFTVAATDLPAGVALADWVKGLRPHEYPCRVGTRLIAERGAFWKHEIAGLPGYRRAACGFVDGVVVVDGRAYVMTYDGPAERGGDVGAFQAFADTIRFGASSPATPPTRPSFTSDRYHYAVTVPDGCTVTPATASWTARAQWDAGGAVDLFECRDGSYSVVRARIPGIASPEAWVAALPERTEGSLCVVRSAGSTTMADAARPDFTPETVAGRPGWVRAACGHVDGVAIVGRVAYIFSVHGPFASGGDMWRFDRFVGSVTFDPAVTEDPAVSYDSILYGYRLAVAPTWTYERSTAPWVPEELDPDAAFADRLTPPGSHGTEVYLLSAAVPAGMSEDEVVARWFASRSHDSLNPCNGADFMGIRPVDWQPLTIDGQPGRTRAACGFVEGVSFVDGRAYLVVAKGEYVYAGARDETVEAFYTTVERLDLQPETAVGVDRLASDVYGYAVRVPANWQVGPATRSWVPGTMPSRSTRADWYDPVDPELQVLVASATIPDGTSEGDWISRFLPTRRQGELGRCTNLGSFMGMTPETWDPMTIAGREGRVRSACGYVDWVEVIGDRAYIVTADGPFRYDGATPSTWAALELFVANLDLRPEDAVATPPYP